MTVSIIVAAAQNGAIGYENGLLYRLPDDMKRFKQLTTGHTIVMGRRTFESFPKGALPNRRNIVLSRSVDSVFRGAERCGSLEEALGLCVDEEEVFVIGGESVYKQALPLAERLYMTRVLDVPSSADAFFPQIDLKLWRLVGEERHGCDDRHAVAFVFEDYVRLH